jgi:hypothetical protein
MEKSKVAVELEELCLKVHRKILNARSILQIIGSDKFKELWEDTPESERKRVEHIILSNGKDELGIWVKFHPKMELGELSIIRLRERARRLRIKNYCRMAKHELIREIDITIMGVWREQK